VNDRGGRRGDAWRYERFLTTVEELTGLDRDHAERATMATLTTLAERITRSRALELGEDLPLPLQTWLDGATDRPEHFHIEEFVRRVAEREEVDHVTAARHARAVFQALARMAPAYELDDLVADLPHEYEPLLGDVARTVREETEPRVRSFEAFVERLKRRADLGHVEAQRTAEAVLETLAERVPGGEVYDLEEMLPEQFRVALERGRRQVDGHPRKLSLDEFVELVAEREHVSLDEAFQHTRAVFATLAEALPPDELEDVLAALPRAYRETLL
jgi:uncharacterized protein (DUF2267 family)